jgi:hypothetical protein
MENQKPEAATGEIEILETYDIPPCPRCRKPLRVIRKNRSFGMSQSEAVYSCDACGELLGIGYGLR